MSQKLYEKIADALVEDGYVVIEKALGREFSLALLKLAKNEKDYTSAGISSSQDLHIEDSKRSDKTLWIDEDSSSQSEYLSFANGLQEYLNRSLYLGLKYYESHFALYDDGDFYEKHLDAFRGEKNRIVTSVYYLNEEWKESDGGELVIYDANDELLAKVAPNADTLVVFLSERFPHEVLPAKSKRYSIAGWFRVDSR